MTAALPRAKQTIWRGRLGQSQISGSSMRPAIAGHLARHPGDVDLRHLPALELPAEVALGEAGPRHQHDAGGVAVEAVDEERVGEGGAGAGLEAVLRARRLGRDGVEAGGLVPGEEVGVGVEEHGGRKVVG